MISEHNFEKSVPQLRSIIKERGWKLSVDNRRSWDTYVGWENRGRTVLYGSKGFKVLITVKTKDGFRHRNKTLFSINQTLSNEILDIEKEVA